MLRAGSSRARRRPTPLLGWLLPTAVMATAVAVAAAVVSAGARAGVLWCGATGTVLVAVVAAESARRGRALGELREHHTRKVEDLERRLAGQEDELDRLAKVELRRVVAGARYGYSMDILLQPIRQEDAPVSPRFRKSLVAVTRGIATAVDDEVSRRDSAERAFVNISRRVQAIIHRQAKDLREMEDRHGNDPAVFDDLLRLDHGNALTGRLADSIAVLSGARPGRQWNRPIALYSVLRGGMSRILEYQRVDLHPVTQISVTGPAVEPLIHAVAELLDNATRYSPPHTHVHLSASEVQSGVAIEIEDGGLGLTDEATARAERAMREAMVSKDFDDLTESPRLGFAIVGRLCQAYGFQVSLRRSAYGGVRAVLVVPQELLTTAPPTGRAHGIGAFSGPRPLPANSARHAARPWGARTTSAGVGPSYGSTNPWGSSVAAGGDDEVIVTERTANGLPQRRRHVPMGRSFGTPARGTAQPAGPAAGPASGPVAGSTAHPDQPAYPPQPAQPARPAKEPKQPGLWLEAFMDGYKGTGTSAGGSGPATGPTGPTSEETAGKGEQ
ncbi:sensor histidine kinase [Streptomyces sp. 1331.2]|uniref:sensor histidine kinase n=1 Tax=Streptomyces sp. 1331.2 TaxID=1938835 RepID=UPI000BCDA293|nr:ATP-binding protein [Streptomyces sp. 1331.2]SOB86269.1 Signal transduction histidine kinase [Streptomyces sp. 1331.2]